MLYIPSIFFLIMGFVQKRQFVLMICFGLFLWSLYAFSSGNADYLIHQTRFYNYRELTSQTELIYSFLMRVFNSARLDYRAFLVCDSLFVCWAYFRFIRRNANYSNFVLALYLIYPFCMDVTMVRYTLAFAVVLYGLDSLWKDFRVKKYLICVFLGFLIHSSMILTLLFLLPRFFKEAVLKKIVLLGVLGLFAGGSLVKAFLNIVAKVSFFNLGEKSSIVLTASLMRYDADAYFRYGMKIFMAFLIMWFVFRQINKFLNTIQNVLLDSDRVKVLMISFASRLNLVVLLIVPLVVFSADVFRVQLSLSVVFYVAVANYLELKKKYQPYKNSIFVQIGTVAYAVFNLYMWVLGGPNVNSVWKPLFFNNVLWG